MTTDVSTNDPLYDFLYTWVDLVLNQERGLGISIKQSHQNTPASEDPYIIIDYAPNRTKIGRPSKTDPDENGLSKLNNDYSNVMEIWEVNGTGSLLQLLIDSVERQSIQDLWSNNKYSYLSQETIQNLPRTQENKWKRESMVEITIGSATGTSDRVGFIEKTKIEGTIPAQGRSGDDHEIKIEEEN